MTKRGSNIQVKIWLMILFLLDREDLVSANVTQITVRNEECEGTFFYGPRTLLLSFLM